MSEIPEAGKIVAFAVGCVVGFIGREKIAEPFAQTDSLLGQFVISALVPVIESFENMSTGNEYGDTIVAGLGAGVAGHAYLNYVATARH